MERKRVNRRTGPGLLLTILMIAAALLSSGAIQADDTAPEITPTEVVNPAEVMEPIVTSEEQAPQDEGTPEPTIEPEEDPAETSTPENPTTEPTQESTSEFTQTPVMELTQSETPTVAFTETLVETLTETPTETPTVTPTETPTETPTLTATPEEGMNWSLQIDSISKSVYSQANDLSDNLQAQGLSSELSAQGSGLYSMSVSGEDGIEEIRDVLYDTLEDNVSFIGGAAEVIIEMPLDSTQAIKINLESNPSTGYGWEVVEAESQGVSMDSEIDYAGRGRIGSPDKVTLTLKPKQIGDASIHLVYRRSFGPDEDVTRHLTIIFDQPAQDIDLSNPDPVDGVNEEEVLKTDGVEEETLSAQEELPSSWDWRSHGINIPIRDQDPCGTCWAFGTVGAMEAAMVKAGMPVTDLSEQFLVSCNKDGLDCNSGGGPVHKYHYNTLGKNQSTVGAVLESDMPYTGEGICTTVSNHPYRLSSYGSDYNPSTAQIKSAIYKYGSVIASICTGNSMIEYHSGIFSIDESDYCGGVANHIVLLVGWNDSPGYWILRNSWGSDWGESGYMRIAYGTSNVGRNISWATYTTPQPVAPVLTSPAKALLTNDNTPTFGWNSSTNAASYQIQISTSSSFATVTQSQTDISALTYTAGTLSDGKYFWRVRGKNAYNSYGAWSSVRYFTVDTTPPLPPVLSKPLNAAEIVGTPTFSWAKSVEAVSYQFQYGTSTNSSSYIHQSPELTSVSYKPQLMTAMTQYYWFVRAKDKAGNWSAWSSPFSLYVSPAIPTKPVLFSPTKNMLTNDATIDLAWTAVDSGAAYHVQLSRSSKFSYIDAEQDGITTQTFTTGALEDGKYYWRVRASNLRGVYGAWSSAWYFTVDTTPPLPPALSKPLNASEIIGTPTFSWKKSAGAISYQFQYGTSTSTSSYIHRSTEITKVSYKPPMMNSMTQYYWFVRAKDKAGNWSSWSTPFSLYVSPPIPAKPVLTSPIKNLLTNDTTVDLSWNAVDYGAAYHIQISRSSKFSYVDAEQEGITTQTLTTGALADGKYYWRVRAKNQRGVYGSWSSAHYFTVDTIAPTAPVLVSPPTGTTKVGTQIFKWKSSATAYRYQFEYNTSNSSSSYVHRSGELSSTSYKPPLMAPLTQFYWFVRACDKAGNWSGWSPASTITIQPSLPAKVVLNSPVSGYTTTSTSFTVSWNAVDYGNTYQIQIDDSSSFSSVDYTYTSAVGAISFTVGPLNGAKWYWRVRAKNVSNEYGAWSSARYFTVYPTFDTQFNTSGNFENWQQHPGATWTVSSGTLGTNSLGSYITSSASYSNSTFTDFTYKVKLKMAGPELDQNDYFGLVIRGTPSFDSNNDWLSGYYFVISQANFSVYGHDACVFLYKITDGQWTNLLGDTWVCGDFINYSDYNTFEVYAKGNLLKFYVNDVLALSKSISGPTSGRLGVLSYGTSAKVMSVDWATAGIPVLPTSTSSASVSAEDSGEREILFGSAFSK